MILDLEELKDDAKPNLTPMIDVVFLLIIFFMVATTFVREEKEVDVALPDTPSASPLEDFPDEVVVNVMRDGSVKVSGRRVSEEGLRDLLLRAKARNEKQSVLIRGDRGTKYEHVVRVVGICHETRVAASLATLEQAGGG